jgi:hypothetical protein
MKSSIIATIMAAAGASAAPSPKPPATFSIMSLRSASPLHFGQVSAAQSNIFIHLPEQNATCKGDYDATQATFYISNDKELFLYTPKGQPAQKVYVDRSGMGQGNVGYATGNEVLPRYAETKGWINDGSYLSFNGSGLLACPNSIDGAWSVWVSVLVDKPGNQEGCLGFNPRILPVDKPTECTYTHY